MKSQYDIKAWAAETTLGRHIFNANYRMMGNEFRGWELVKTVIMHKAPELTEKVYMWEKKGSEGHQLVRVSVAELPDWQSAHTQLGRALLHSMRSDIPRGGSKLAPTGDINFVAKAPKSRAMTSMYFTRGNLSINIMSAGDKAVDVTKLATVLDGLFTEPPESADVEKGLVEELSPKTLQVKAKKTTPVIDHVSETVADGGWLKIIASDGELKREDDTVLFISTKAGRKRIGKYIVAR